MTEWLVAILDLIGALALAVAFPMALRFGRNRPILRTVRYAAVGVVIVLLSVNVGHFMEHFPGRSGIDPWTDTGLLLIPVLLFFFLNGLQDADARRKSREQERRLRWLLECSRDGLLVQKDFRILECNKVLEAMSGYTREELIGMDGRRLVAPEYHAEVQTHIAKGSEEPYEVEGVRKDGARFPVLLMPRNLVGKDAGTRLRGVLVRDLTEERARQQALERLSMAVEHAAEAIVITDTEGNIQYVNPAFTRITGYSSDEAVGQNPRIVKSGKHDQAFYEQLWNTITSGKVWRGSFINRRKDGSLYHEEAAIAPVKNEQGRIVHFVAVKRDATVEAELRNQLQQAQKLKAVGQLAGGVAHEYNNILQAVIGNLAFVLEATPHDDPRREDLLEMHKSLERAADITHRLLAFSRRRLMRLEPIDINEMVQDLFKMLRTMIPEHIRIDFVPGPNIEPVRGDRPLLEQVIVNLAVNARDAMPDGGTIMIRTAGVTIDGAYLKTHPWAREGRFALLTVADTGTGIPPDVLPHIFDPFFTTKETGKGTGLGLSMVHGTVEQHDGMIHVHSEPGNGTTFEIYLPVAPGEKEESVHVSTHESVRGGDETVLLAEDDPGVLAISRRMLEAAGYTVFSAGDGEQAVELFSKHKDEIDAAIIDVIMPGRNGREVFETIRAVRPHLPILFCSGYTDDLVPADLLENEDCRILRKPFRREELLRALRTAIDESHERKGRA